MRVAIATDIHGNRHAFEAVIAAAEESGAEELWCLGDLVGYGGDPDASVALARRHCTVCLAGNHDLAVVDVLSLDEFSRGAALAAQWTREVILPETREFLLSLKPEGAAGGVGLYHASPRDPIWEYVLSGLTAELCFDVTDHRVSLIGHSHVALSFDRQEGSPASLATATRARPGCSWTPETGPPRTAAPNTTSRARWPPSARQTCRSRSPSASSTGSEGSLARAERPQRPLAWDGACLAVPSSW